MTGAPDGNPPARPRSLLERAGLAGIASVLALIFGGLGLVAWNEGEVFLAVMSGTGALMTVWAALSSVVRR